MPVVKTRNMTSEMSLVERVRHVLTTCGRNATVVQNAAARPMDVLSMRRYVARSL